MMFARKGDPLDRIVIPLGKDDGLTPRMLLEGTFCEAQTGGGKSSAVLPAYLAACLHLGYGGLFCCAKPGDAAYFKRLAVACGRERDVIMLGPGHPDSVNLIDHEAAYGEDEVTRLLATAIDISHGRQRESGDSAYWNSAGVKLERNVCVMLRLAGMEVSLNNIIRFIADMPRDYVQMVDDDWRKRSYAYHVIRQAQAAPKDEMQAQSYEVSDTYFAAEVPGMGDRQQGSVISVVTVSIDPLLHGERWRILGNKTSVRPEQAYTEGKLFCFDMDIATYGDAGRLCQCLFKYVFQRQMLRGGEDKRPAFLICDEAQNFVTSYDRDFQSVARGFKVAVLYLTQNIANLNATLGSKDHVDALLGSLTTHIYGCNTDTGTNTFAAERIGRKWITKTGWGTNLNEQRREVSASGSQHHEYDVQPKEFQTLASGGTPHKNMVEVIVHRAGAWSNGKSWIKAALPQF